MRILLIEDEQKIAGFLRLELEHEGYSVTCCNDGREGLDISLKNDFDLMILDLMLPNLNGLEVLRRFRLAKQTPVIILTARDQIMDKVSGLDIGANDYMTKPFQIEELLARIRVHMRDKKASTDTIEVGKLKMHTDSVEVYYDGNRIDITKKEFDLLVYLANNKNIVISREQALDAVWGYDFVGNTNVVDVYVRYIRSKIDDVYQVKIIHTIRGAGYIIRD